MTGYTWAGQWTDDTFYSANTFVVYANISYLSTNNVEPTNLSPDQDLNNWNTSNVIDMRCMFQTASFNGDISKWNVSNVENMQYMFNESKFNGDISKWDVSNVTDMSQMFSLIIRNIILNSDK